VEPLVKAFGQVVKEFYGENPQQSDSYCRIVSDRQFNRLKGLLDNCKPDTIVVGGKTDASERYIEPTVVCPVAADDNNLMASELFGKHFIKSRQYKIQHTKNINDILGPILPIVPYENIDEAIQIVNNGDHPLALYVFSSKTATYDYSKCWINESS
jgi:acyl-CoA reductase-like NAD-dependent aldehyde dehydrogenase